MTLQAVYDGALVAIQLPDDTAEAARMAAAAIGAAGSAALSAQAALGAANFYSTIAAGVAATPSGEMFTSAEGGTWNYYIRTASTPFYTLFRPVLSIDPAGNLTLTPAAGWSIGNTAALFFGDVLNYVLAQFGGPLIVQGVNDVVITSGSTPVELARFTQVGSYRALFNASVRPAFDNAFSLGASGARWTEVFAATGTINTSDARDKVWRGGLSPAELTAAKRILAELGFYQWADAVAEKGPDGARYHFGARAQAVWAIMADEGLVDPIGGDGKPGDTPYAFLCFDEWDEEPARPAVLGEGNEVLIEAADAVPAGNRFGLRVDQLSLFLIAAQETRLAALEAALA